MSAAPSATFRGYRAIEEVVALMKPYGEWLALYRPDIHAMTLRRRDLDVLQRWPKAATLFNIHTNDAGVTYWRGFELRADKSPTRYPDRFEIPPPP